MNLDHLKLLYCKFQKYEVMTMSAVGDAPKKYANSSYKAAKHIERTFLISDYYSSIIVYPADKYLLPI